ncbi:hypothetical protein ABZX65_27075 [Streptomyces sp. NPDC003300]|uniref:hypothetical protein n=1 Tax=unclassified Streptomyces TaxID=2593676 RepID=UPI0033A57F3E
MTTATPTRRYLNRKQRELNTHRGIPNRVNATQARQHLTLLRQTMGWTDIAAATGCSACHLRAILSGATLTINRVTHDKILNTPAAVTPSGGLYIDATGTRRRIQALMARGHSQQAIADAATTTQHRISVISLGAPRVRQTIADRIANAYRQLADRDGTSKRALFLAAKYQWHDTEFWDDVDRIDDPDFDPGAKQLRIDQVGEDATWLKQAGLTVDQIAHRLGISRDYAEKGLRHAAQSAQAAA